MGPSPLHGEKVTGKTLFRVFAGNHSFFVFERAVTV